MLDNPKVVRLHCADGEHGLDDVPDDVPYDLDQPVVTIAPEHFVYWFHDCRDHPDRYNGKIIAVEGTVKRGPQLGPGGICHWPHGHHLLRSGYELFGLSGPL